MSPTSCHCSMPRCRSTCVLRLPRERPDFLDTPIVYHIYDTMSSKLFESCSIANLKECFCRGLATPKLRFQTGSFRFTLALASEGWGWQVWRMFLTNNSSSDIPCIYQPPQSKYTSIRRQPFVAVQRGTPSLTPLSWGAPSKTRWRPPTAQAGPLVGL